MSHRIQRALAEVRTVHDQHKYTAYIYHTDESRKGKKKLRTDQDEFQSPLPLRTALALPITPLAFPWTAAERTDIAIILHGLIPHVVMVTPPSAS